MYGVLKDDFNYHRLFQYLAYIFQHTFFYVTTRVYSLLTEQFDKKALLLCDDLRENYAFTYLISTEPRHIIESGFL